MDRKGTKMNEWQLNIELNNNSIENIEKYIQKKLPVELISFLMEANASYPKNDRFKVESSEYIVNNILNFNESSEESFYDSFDNLKENIKDFIPLAKDGFGNYYLIDLDNLKVYFYNHENNGIQYLFDFDKFIEALS